MSIINFIFTFIRYFISGGTAFLVHMGLLILHMEYSPIKIDPTLATTIAFGFACIVNYLIQYHWTFKASGSHKRFFSRYIFVTSITMCLNAGIFWYCFEKMYFPYIISQIIATGFVFITNFIINYFYTFKKTRKKSIAYSE